jgi:hypothetical protein
MTTIKYNLFALKNRLESKTSRPYPWTEVSRQSGVNINTIKNLVGNKTGRVDLENLARLIDFFKRQGLPVTLSDIFTVTETDSPQ